MSIVLGVAAVSAHQRQYKTYLEYSTDRLYPINRVPGEWTYTRDSSSYVDIPEGFYQDVKSQGVITTVGDVIQYDGINGRLRVLSDSLIGKLYLEHMQKYERGLAEVKTQGGKQKEFNYTPEYDANPIRTNWNSNKPLHSMLQEDTNKRLKGVL